MSMLDDAADGTKNDIKAHQRRQQEQGPDDSGSGSGTDPEREDTATKAPESADRPEADEPVDNLE